MVTTKDIPAGEPISPDSPERDQPYRKELDPGLANRLDNLWPGHPSSPQAADGTRKPPVPNPFRNEAPIPGDPDYRAEILAAQGTLVPKVSHARP